MIFFPAIDIINGSCVRLEKGVYSSASVVASNPVDTARAFREQGATHLHVVDLDGAKSGVRENAELIGKICAAFGGFVELGGGLRDLRSCREALGQGVSRVVLGSAAFRDRELLRAAAQEFGSNLAVGIDAKRGFVSLAGWLDDTKTDYIDFARECEQLGVKNVIYTDIGRDGMLDGPDFDGLSKLRSAVNMNITASGGVTTLGDIEKLRDMGLYAAICGKAVYTGGVPVAEAVAICAEKSDGAANPGEKRQF